MCDCHQVHNLEDAISINHNWFNAYNIRWVGDYYYKAMEYIEDIKDICDDFEGLCQQNLAANTERMEITIRIHLH
ncbi:arginine-specific demethylase JMJ20-like [Malus sylvestris]|uniref:arginine-specific demethylase JMJ20-like n=1 Tax=Malus sylvestris TaxID=3752 RepID=UPI0021ABCC55|nr:arginine-specific demethylase JMJ20-like [Malus sylvestris]